MTRRILLLASGTIGLAAGVFAQSKFGKPKTVLHMVTLYFRDTVTPEQKKSVYDGIEKMAAEIPGIRNIWLKPLKVQGHYEERNQDGSLKKAYPYTDGFAIEFESQEALDKFADHPARKAWEQLYLPLRGRSTTNDITN